MNDLVYSIANTFGKDNYGVLGQSKAKCFFIAPYQRGYKWGSASASSPVQLLMTDLKDAFRAKSQEYYLQYITISSNKREDDSNVLEVIDGQQRLTTLTVLFSVMGHRLLSEESPITDGLLSYGVRKVVGDFIDAFIYKNIATILDTTWDEFITIHSQYDEQDIYYLFHSAQKINELLPEGEDLIDFYQFVAHQVKLIINKVESSISCEKVFANLNTNKVDLTSAELIKGLLLTKSARTNPQKNETIRFKEIMELRAVIGRQWDEINRWCCQPEINSFFFKNSPEPIHQLLYLLAKKEGYESAKTDDKNKYELFNYFQSNIKKGEKTARDYFLELKELQSILNDWFQNDLIYNHLGYLLNAKKTSFQIEAMLPHLEEDKSTLQSTLKQKVHDTIPTEIKDLEYGITNDEIHRLLLALSVFSNLQRFDFHAFQAEDWSLEHIFPQNPDEFSNELEAADIKLINTLIGKKLDKAKSSKRLNSMTEEMRINLKTKLAQERCSLNKEEVKQVCDLMNSDQLNSIGNMALLTRSDNSSISNGMFNAKRLSIATRVSQGSFVPKHTYDIFSKLISKTINPDLTVWAEEDIQAHNVWIEETLSQIIPQQKEDESRTKQD